ncbi:hypothetical protein Tco_1088085 [Tanacetum coccineum]
MLGFLSNCCISNALTIQPFAIYVEYLKEFWFTAEVDEATKTITFSLSSVEKPLTFTRDEFITAIGLPICSNAVLLPPKETVRAGLATLGLCDKDKPNLSSMVLVNSSPLKIEPLLNFYDLVNKLQNRKKKREAHICYTRVILPKTQVTETQHAKEPEATTDATRSLDTSKSKEEQVNQPTTAEAKKGMILKGCLTLKTLNFAGLTHLCMKVNPWTTNGDPSLHYKFTLSTTKFMQVQDQNIQEDVKESGLDPMEDVTFDQIMDEIDQKNKDAEKVESPYDTKSKIIIIKSFQATTVFGSLLIHQGSQRSASDDLDAIDITPKGDKEVDVSDSRLCTAETFHASADKPTQSNPLCHLHEELCTLNMKVNQLESSITKQVIDAIHSSVPSLVADTLK